MRLFAYTNQPQKGNTMNYQISMKDKEEGQYVTMYSNIFDFSQAEFKAENLSRKFPSCLVEVWQGDNLVGTWENGKEW